MNPVRLVNVSVLLAALGSIGYCSLLVPAQDKTIVQDEVAKDAPASTQPRERLGISSEQPTEGPFVSLPDGTFMIPYTTQIPATDVEFTMIPIPGGKFTMGSPDQEAGRKSDEGPQFEVQVEPFWMGKHEITWDEYQKYMAMNDRFREFQDRGQRQLTEKEFGNLDAITAPSILYDPRFTYRDGGEPDQPAATISQFAAKQYTKWLSLMSDNFYRLPYEAEWEYACRAGTNTIWYFGNDPDELGEHAWFSDNSDEYRQKVGQKLPNPWGLHDMYGNVAEWVLDQYFEQGYSHIADPWVKVEGSYRKPTSLFPRVARGGCYLSEAEECRSASRLASDESWREADPEIPKSPYWFTDEPATGVGFRLVRPLNKISPEEMETFWMADDDLTIREVTSRISGSGCGRGILGQIDGKLATELEELEKEKSAK